jgi:hypothetical protein
MTVADRQSEIESNLRFFLAELPKLVLTHRGKFALLRHQTLIAFFDTPLDAVSAGNAQFPDRIFSIQQVTESSIDLGFYSHAVHLGTA